VDLKIIKKRMVPLLRFIMN
jgi:hypothetical protein